MPVYEYMCQSCGQRHEALQKFSDPPLSECPRCKGKLKKLISNNSFVLKGSGWYITDYARKGSKSEGSKPVGSRSEGSKPEGSKPVESKPVASGSGDAPKKEAKTP
ncbi:MAG: transcriptional regulator [Nitrospiraceae bacterium]|nr:transcriptional regulator [Nitrospiraceae bacterium]